MRGFYVKVCYKSEHKSLSMLLVWLKYFCLFRQLGLEQFCTNVITKLQSKNFCNNFNKNEEKGKLKCFSSTFSNVCHSNVL